MRTEYGSDEWDEILMKQFCKHILIQVINVSNLYFMRTRSQLVEHVIPLEQSKKNSIKGTERLSGLIICKSKLHEKNLIPYSHVTTLWMFSWTAAEILDAPINQVHPLKYTPPHTIIIKFEISQISTHYYHTRSHNVAYNFAIMKHQMGKCKTDLNCEEHLLIV